MPFSVKQKILKYLFLLIFFIFGLNSLALHFHWYYTVWYFDMPMHFLGGFWTGLFGFYFLTYFLQFDFSAKLFWKIIFFVFFIGIGWEAFEIFVDKTITYNSFNILDTTSDIFFDLAGGVLVYLLGFIASQRKIAV